MMHVGNGDMENYNVMMAGAGAGDQAWLLHQRTGWNWKELHRGPRHDHQRKLLASFSAEFSGFFIGGILHLYILYCNSPLLLEWYWVSAYIRQYWVV